MTRKPKYRSSAYEAAHRSASALFKAGAIDKITMNNFDVACLERPKAFSPRAIKRLREKNAMSQAVFAQYLNTSTSTLQKWETGAKSPAGTALRLLSVVEKHGIEVLT
jgi:putative transcriptional regulator